MSSILQKQIGFLSTLTSLPQAFEIFLAYSGRVEVTAPTVRAIVRGWALLTTSADSVGVTLRLRRGNGLGGAVISGGYAVSAQPPANQATSLIFAESLQNAEYADYSLTASQNGPTGAGSVVYAAIEVEIING